MQQSDDKMNQPQDSTPFSLMELTDAEIDAFDRDFCNGEFNPTPVEFMNLCSQAKRHNALRARIDAAGGEVAADPDFDGYISEAYLPTIKKHFALLRAAYVALRVKCGEMERKISLAAWEEEHNDKLNAERKVATLAAENADLRARVERAEGDAQRRMACLMFFRSVIQCGEGWTDTCEKQYSNAITARTEEPK